MTGAGFGPRRVAGAAQCSGGTEQSDAPKPPNQAFTQWSDHRGGWVIASVRLSYRSCPDILDMLMTYCSILAKLMHTQHAATHRPYC
jgi:hypothetical protein